MIRKLFGCTIADYVGQDTLQQQAAQQMIHGPSAIFSTGSINETAPQSSYVAITVTSTAAFSALANQPNYHGLFPPRPSSYYIELPETPAAGDTITVRFDGVKWLEERAVAQEAPRIIDPNAPSGFSLSEIEEAKQFMEDCSVP